MIVRINPNRLRKFTYQSSKSGKYLGFDWRYVGKFWHYHAFIITRDGWNHYFEVIDSDNLSSRDLAENYIDEHYNEHIKHYLKK